MSAMPCLNSSGIHESSDSTTNLVTRARSSDGNALISSMISNAVTLLNFHKNAGRASCDHRARELEKPGRSSIIGIGFFQEMTKPNTAMKMQPQYLETVMRRLVIVWSVVSLIGAAANCLSEVANHADNEFWVLTIFMDTVFWLAAWAVVGIPSLVLWIASRKRTREECPLINVQ
jgi:hypothetical protein